MKKITKKSQNTKSQKNKKEIYQQETQKKNNHITIWSVITEKITF